jgi:phosphohistidine phosphatase
MLLLPDDQYDGRGVELRTSGLAVHRSDGSWAETEPGSMHLAERHLARAEPPPVTPST